VSLSLAGSALNIFAVAVRALFTACGGCELVGHAQAFVPIALS